MVEWIIITIFITLPMIIIIIGPLVCYSNSNFTFQIEVTTFKMGWGGCKKWKGGVSMPIIGTITGPCECRKEHIAPIPSIYLIFLRKTAAPLNFVAKVVEHGIIIILFVWWNG